MSSGGSAASGRKARFFLRLSQGTGPWIPAKGIKSIDRAGSTGEEECTDFDSEGKREFLPGLKEATYDFLLNDLHGLDPGQATILGKNDASARFEFRYYPVYEPLSGKDYYTGLMFATADAQTNPLEGPGELSLSLRASGENRLPQSTPTDGIV